MPGCAGAKPRCLNPWPEWKVNAIPMPAASHRPNGPRRILALSGGGVRGVVEVAFLEAVEAAYKRRFGPATRLCDVFQLIGGTSTGALIATALSLGLPLDRVRAIYTDRARRFFADSRWWAFGHLPLFDAETLAAEIRADVGDRTLGSPDLQTYLAIITKRLDTGSPWIVSNVPTAPYWDDDPAGRFMGNRHLRLVDLLLASTAAPTYFDQTALDIGLGETAVFIDGGLSPHNDPSLALLKLARLRAFGLEWPTGPEQLFILSIGSGRYRHRMQSHRAARLGPLRNAWHSLMGMVLDNEENTVALMEWLGTSRRPTMINSEVGALDQDSLVAAPAFGYLRLDLPLEAEALSAAGLSVPEDRLASYRSLSDPEIISPLYDLARAYAETLPDLDTLVD